jgi:hypothetical protein
MNRRLVVVLVIGGGLAALAVGLLWRRAARESTRLDSSGSAGAPAIAGPEPRVRTPAAGEADAAPASGPPPSPLGAAAFYAAKLKACEPPGKTPRDLPVTSFGRADSPWGVTFEITAEGNLLDAKLWGRTGKQQSCLASAVAAWPIATHGQKAMTVEYPMHDLSYGRRPAGDIQLLAATIYDEKAITPAVTKGNWLAICPRPGGSELIPAAPVATRAEVMDGTIWEVKSSACPADDVVMVKGAGLGRQAGAPVSRDGGAGDPSPRPVADGSAGAFSLPTVAGDPTKLIDAAGTKLTLGDRTLRLFTQDVVGKEETGQQILFVASGEIVQVLADYGSEYRVVWAGDLDGDGGIDFVTCNFPEAPTYDLFLSSDAGGRLVRHAGRAIGTDGD